MTDVETKINRSPQTTQQDIIGGLHKGIVFKVQDPHQLGRAGVHVYGNNADFPDLNIDALEWCDYVQHGRGSFAPPELWDGVWVQFDAEDRESPVIVGYWYRVGTGRGTLPHTRVKGTNIRPENWHHHDLYPETQMLSCSGNGNALWTEDKYVSNNFLSSSINLEDTGGKYLEIKSFHPEVAGYASDSDFPENLYQADVPPLCVNMD